MRRLVALLMFSWGLTAAAECPVKRPGEEPAVPNGAVASEAEMHRAQLAVENYLLQAERYLDCGYMNRRQYNLLLTRMEMLTKQYDEELLQFRMRESAVAEK